MELKWKIYAADIRKVQLFVAEHNHSDFVKGRRIKNLRGVGRATTIKRFWHGLVLGLVTTQQRSGPGSSVQTFLHTTPFSLTYRNCQNADDVKRLAKRALTKHGGIRRADTISEQLHAAMNILDSGEKATVKAILSDLPRRRGKAAERDAANYLADTFPGLGPKQSRNLLQSLGLTRYEIPLDSRLVKWLNDFGFPVNLSATGLADPAYYEFVLDGVQELCKAAKIYPCILDAAVFTSFDQK